MHILLGGAHNGKRAFVRAYLTHNGLTSAWFSEEMEIGETLEDVLVMDGIPQVLISLSREERIEWLDYHLPKETPVIWITEDVSRGIVPMEKQQRIYRDECGRITQLLVEKATTVTQIWYGLAEMRKGESPWE